MVHNEDFGVRDVGDDADVRVRLRLNPLVLGVEFEETDQCLDSFLALLDSREGFVEEAVDNPLFLYVTLPLRHPVTNLREIVVLLYCTVDRIVVYCRVLYIAISSL